MKFLSFLWTFWILFNPDLLIRIISFWNRFVLIYFNYSVQICILMIYKWIIELFEWIVFMDRKFKFFYKFIALFLIFGQFSGRKHWLIWKLFWCIPPLLVNLLTINSACEYLQKENKRKWEDVARKIHVFIKTWCVNVLHKFSARYRNCNMFDRYLFLLLFYYFYRLTSLKVFFFWNEAFKSLNGLDINVLPRRFFLYVFATFFLLWKKVSEETFMKKFIDSTFLAPQRRLVAFRNFSRLHRRQIFREIIANRFELMQFIFKLIND